MQHVDESSRNLRRVPSAPRPERRGLQVERRHTRAGLDPFDSVAWVARRASIGDGSGGTVFDQEDIEAPQTWSQLALNVVASKYFRGHEGHADRERSVRDLIRRVAHTIADWGRADGYFLRDADAEAFRDELVHLLLHQKYAFNSPVWFNVGVDPTPQCSACFINSVEDTMESILELAKTEARLFKGGSGTGSNLSTIRASNEPLAGGGTASGPVSFMRGFDAFAGVIKSGGKTRRAAKMVILNSDHPDIMEFIDCKADEEKKAWALIEQGYDGSFNGEAYRSIFFQNANHSVRVTDAFMEAADKDHSWPLRSVLTNDVLREVSARSLLERAASAAHLCGDPGLQYDSTINRWNPCKASGRIEASNPCSEYMFLSDSACNLGSINLMNFVDSDGSFQVDDFQHACRLATIAQEIIVDNSSYPTGRIAQNSHDFRPLGLGYANLGALLMSSGLPYDSDAGRNVAAAITAVMTGTAYAASAEIARERGPFRKFAVNRESFLEVIGMHRDHAYALTEKCTPAELRQAARESWDEALELGDQYGFRNAQVSVIAPTGTIAFMMDCDTTGIEPDIALIKYKRLVGGGILEIVNQSVGPALERLGYDDAQRRDILEYTEREGTIEGAPHLRSEDLPVFDCAFRPAKGARSISPRGHLEMMAAVQPFLSGAISKTVNLPANATVQDFFDLYVSAWRSGLKAVALYRDGSKRTQPLDTKKEESTPSVDPVVRRRRLEPERASLTHKFAVGGHEGYITVGLYPDGSPGELFITMSKEGSTISGLMDTIATSISLALQYGVPLRVLVDRFSHMRFEPAGFTGNPNIPMAKSLVDYIFRWLGQKFLRDDDAVDTTLSQKQEAALQAALESNQMRLPIPDAAERKVFLTQADAPPCPTCGSIMVRAGNCYLCANCGTTSGCS